MYVATRGMSGEAGGADGEGASDSKDSDSAEEGRVSLASLASASGLSLLHLLDNLSKWGQMASNDSALHQHVAKVQSRFAVGAVVFRKYVEMFRLVFVTKGAGAKGAGPAGRSARQARSRAGAAGRTGPEGALLRYLWSLYCAASTDLGEGGAEDVLTAFHLLLSVVETGRRALVEAGAAALVQPDFLAPDGDGEEESGGLTEELAERFHASVLDAKHFHVHWWRGKVERLREAGRLPSADEAGSPLSYERARLLLEQDYEEALLHSGHMDQRWLVPKEPEELLTEAAVESPLLGLQRGGESEAGDAELLLRMSLQSCLEKISQIRLPTPLSGRSYVIAGDQFCPATPISAAAAAGTRLAALVADAPRRLSPDLLALFPSPGGSEPPANPPDLVARVLGESAAAVRDALGEGPETELLLRQAQGLYYRLLHRLFANEAQRPSTQPSSSGLRRESLHRSLVAVAYELVLFSHRHPPSGKENVPGGVGGGRDFPWVLSMVGVEALQFYKVIEPVIRAEAGLSREMVKRLNRAEERVLEELGWAAESSLWGLVAAAEGLPSAADVALPSHLDSAEPPSPSPKRRLEFQRPGPGTMASSGFGPSPTKVRAVGMGGQPLRAVPALAPAPVLAPPPGPPSALELFCRKAYYLCSVRLADLGERLGLAERTKQAAWTLLEAALRRETELAKGRHLDQLLLSALYMACRVAGAELSFQDILCAYRHQPQASSAVYRSVLLDPVHDDTGDLVHFYNRLFLPRLEEVGRRLAVGPGKVEGGEGEALPLSPLLQVRSGGLSPRRKVAEGVFVSPLALPGVPASPTRPLRYSFSRSPYKDLKAINSMIRHGSQPPRRFGLSDSLATRRIHFPSNLS